MQIVLIFLIVWIGSSVLIGCILDNIFECECITTIITMCYIVVGFFWGLCFVSNNIDNYFTEQAEYSVEISAIKDNLDINGNISGGIFYSSGYIETDLYYYYIVEEKYGKKTYKTKASHTYINETDETPKIVYVKNVTDVPKWLDYWGWFD